MPAVVPFRGGDHAADAVRERATRLFTFLREYARVRGRAASADAAADEILWLAEIPRAPGCRCAAFEPSERDGEVWVEVRRPRLPPPPEPPDILKGWLRPGALDSPSEDVAPLFDRIDDPSADPPRRVSLEERPDVVEAFETYVRQQWQPWAERDRELRRQERAYADLFRLHQAQRWLGESYEVVLGLGHLAWRTPAGAVVRRHLVVAQTDVRFDAAGAVVTVTAAADGARPVLEREAVEPRDRPPPDEQGRIDALLEEVGDDVFGDEAIPRCLQDWARAASRRGRYRDDLEPPGEPTPDPVVHLAPALVLRRRSERAIVQAIDAIVAQLKAGARVPDGVRRLVDIVEGGGTVNGEAPAPGPTPPEILFPLPANDEQVEVARRLQDRPGVLVQGPPGTGKSHTIANLVAHLLAEGQRVLVTSPTGRALEPLRDMLPGDVRELAVFVLGNDARGRDEMRASVRAISTRHGSWSPRAPEERVAALREGLATARSREADAVARLRVLREADTERHPPRFGGYEGTTQQIGMRLRQQAAGCAWITGLAGTGECPLTDEEASELLRLLRASGAGTEEELDLAAPDPAGLPGPDDFTELAGREQAATRDGARFAPFRQHPAYGPLRAAPEAARRAFWSALFELSQARGQLRGRAEPWVAEATEQVLGRRSRRWRELESFTRDTLEALRPALEAVGRAQVTGIEGRAAASVLADADALLKRRRRWGRVGLGPPRPAAGSATRYLLEDARVDGVPCREPEALERLAVWLRLQAQLARLDAEWSGVLEAPSGPATLRAAEYDDIAATLREVLGMESKLTAAAAAAAAVPGLATPPWHDADALQGVLGALDASHRDTGWWDARGRLAALEAALESARDRPAPHPLAGRLLGAVRERDVQGYASAREALDELEARRDRRRLREELMRRLRAAAPALAGALEAGPPGPEWDGRLGSLRAAWEWARADEWLRDAVAPDELRRIAREMDGARSDRRRTTRELAAELAWAHCLGRLSESERQHLMAWENAVRKIGRGTGRHAPYWRRLAREAMQGCRTAVPVWVMPVLKVAETVDLTPEAFDVVIVDEAGRSGPEALFLQFLARRMVIVGDDQQIGPDGAGLARAEVEQLNAQYLGDVPLGAHLNADSSLLDHARIRYRDRVTLREHFRCMPEIIQFSNELCYRESPLVPLRQHGAGRLRPVIRVAPVPGAGGERGAVSEPEARAVAAQVAACLTDPTYAGRTFGVISLAGAGQARRIAQLLAERVDPAEIERRRLVCGEPEAFQGSERDVVFLSLVLGPRDGRADHDRRRFNVAASRARDQMWLFHTAPLQDLDPEGMPHRLLRHCQRPQVEPAPVGEAGLELLRRRAGGPRRGERPPAPFDSWLEVDVFLRIADRGHRVIPQCELAGHRVDLLVEGAAGQLAVECDGDVWDGEEEFEREMSRQRALERCGVRFFRARGPVFYRDPDAAMEDLWADVGAAGIAPEAADAQPVAEAGAAE